MSKKIQWYILVILAVFFNAHCWADKNNTLPEKVAGSFVLPPFHVYARELSETSGVGSKIPRDINEISASVTIVNSDEMERLGVYNLTDALEYNAGITVAPRGYDSLYNFSKLRGFDIAHSNVVVDGMKTFGASDNMTSPELYGVEQIEILRGPASALYGSGSVGGMLNLRTKHPRPENFAEGQVQIGSQGERMTAVDVNGVSSDSSLYGRVVSVWRTQDLFYDETKQKRIYVAPAFTKKFGAKGNLTILPFYSKDKIDGYAYSPRTRVPGDLLYGVLPDRYFVGVKGWDKYYLTQRGISYEWEQPLGKGITFHQKGSYRKANVLSNQTTGIANPLAGLVRFGAMIDSEGTSYGLDQFVHLHKETDHFKSDTLLGFDWRYEKIFTEQKMRNLSAWPLAEIPGYLSDKPIPADPDINVPGTIIPMDDLHYWSRERGIYLSHMAKEGKLSYSLGLRRGLYGQYSERDEEKFSQSAWTGQAGAVYNLNRKWAPYIHWHNSFEPLMHLDKDNKMLKPTTGREWEIGMRYAPENTPIRVTASLFDLRKQNIHVGVPGESYFTSIGEIVSKGMELEWRAALHERLHLLGSYTYLDTKTTKHTNPDRIGLRPAGVARKTFNLRADAILTQYHNGELMLGLGTRYIGKRMDEENKITLGGVTLYDASVSLSRGKDAWTFHVRNLFDKKYMSGIESMWGTPLGFAGQDRTWILSYIHKW